MGKTDLKEYEGLKYVIMFGIHKVSDQSMYRKDMYKSKRKELSEIWKGDTLGIGEIVRFAPSFVNSQPWIVENKDNVLSVTRFKNKVSHWPINIKSSISIKSFRYWHLLCFIELRLINKSIEFGRKLFY